MPLTGGSNDKTARIPDETSKHRVKNATGT